MQPVTAALPSCHPRVINVSYKSLMAALVPRYVATFNQDTTLPKSKSTTEAIAKRVLRRTLRLLTEYQGQVPVDAALSYVYSAHKTRQLTATERRIACRLLEMVAECSELIVTDCDGTIFSMHPEWSRRLCERYDERAAKILAMTANWQDPVKNPH